MKFIFTLIFAALISFTAAAQSSYSLQTVALGTNAIPASNNLALPLLLSSVTVTSTPAITLTGTNISSFTNAFTLPSATNLTVTVTNTAPGTVSGTATNTFYSAITVTNKNPTAYYATNGAYYTYSNGVVIATNATTYKTNYQTFTFSTSVPFTIVGTNYQTYVTNAAYGASVIDVRQSATVAVKVGFKLTGSGTSAVTFSYIPNIDSIYDPLIPIQTISLVANGTNAVATNVSITAGPLGYLIFNGITNGNASGVTNLFFKYAQKVNSP